MGVILGVAMVLTFLIGHVAIKMDINGNLSYILMVMFTGGIVGFIIWANKNASQLGKSMAFKDIFSESFKFFASATLIYVVFTAIFFSIDASLREKGIADNTAALIAQGNKTAKEIEDFNVNFRKLFLPMIIGITTFKHLILGALVTAVTGALITNKNK